MVLLTNVTNNMVVGALMVGVSVPIAISLGIDDIQIVFLITFVSDLALILPASSAPALLMFSNVEWVRPKTAYAFVIPTILVLMLVAFIWNIVVFLFI